MRVRLGVLLAAFCGTLAIGATEASAALEFCKRADSGRSCATLAVPLDRTGTVPGTVKLRIERQKAKRSTRPPLFLIAGGPGQSATDAFDSEVVEAIAGTEARSRDIVVMDLRGTGRSGALDCPALQRGIPKAATVTACATRLGPRRDFYSSVDMADDIDAVRAALGVERIALYGISYGTYVTQVYARRHPTRVERLVLDSVVGPDGVDLLERTSMAAVPRTVESSCGRRLCRRFLRDPGGATTRLAARLDQRPLRGYVVDRGGRRRPASIDGRGLLDLAAFSPTLGADFPGVVSAAARGDSAPLLRGYADLYRLIDAVLSKPRSSSGAATVATLCSDSELPWPSTASLGDRRAAAGTLVDALPASAFAPFGRRTALAGHFLEMCLGWPSSPRSKAVLGPLPDVPALLLAGGADANTPLEDAAALRALLPRAELMVVPGVGHDVIDSGGDCPGRAVRRFLAGGVAGTCGRPAYGRVTPPPPASLAQLRPRGARGLAGRTVTAVQLTTIDAFNSLVLAAFMELVVSDAKRPEDVMPRVGALRGGSYVSTSRGFELSQASLVPGVRVSGVVRVRSSGRVRASLTVGGRGVARGRLTLRRDMLAGTLGGRTIKVRFHLLERAFGLPTSSSRSSTGRVVGLPSTWAPASLDRQARASRLAWLR